MDDGHSWGLPRRTRSLSFPEESFRLPLQRRVAGQLSGASGVWSMNALLRMTVKKNGLPAFYRCGSAEVEGHKEV